MEHQKELPTISEENVARARELFTTIRVLQRRLFHWYSERVGSTSRPALCEDVIISSGLNPGDTVISTRPVNPLEISLLDLAADPKGAAS